jgi:hypothetical protein
MDQECRSYNRTKTSLNLAIPPICYSIYDVNIYQYGDVHLFRSNIMEEIQMKKLVLVISMIFLIAAGLLFGAQLSPATAKEPKILEFDTMVGNTAAFTGATNPIRGINGGGLPWTLTSAHGELKASGKLELTVQGLVLAAGASTGINPIANFRAIVSCLGGDGSVQNVTSGLFPATVGAAVNGGGNATIETTLSLPQPCIAPIIFVTSPASAWFAATGR